MIKSLNLLSIEEQKEIRQERIFLIVRNFSIIFICIFIFSSVILYSSHQVLMEESALLTKQSQAVDDRSKKINDKVIAFNQMLGNIEKIQKEDIHLDNKILLIIEKIPATVKINYLSIDKDSLLFNIYGLAPTRELFLQMKNNFDQDKKKFKDITTPDISLTARTNISFTLSGHLIIEGFKPKTTSTTKSINNTGE